MATVRIDGWKQPVCRWAIDHTGATLIITDATDPTRRAEVRLCAMDVYAVHHDVESAAWEYWGNMEPLPPLDTPPELPDL